MTLSCKFTPKRLVLLAKAETWSSRLLLSDGVRPEAVQQQLEPIGQKPVPNRSAVVKRDMRVLHMSPRDGKDLAPGLNYTSRF